MQTKPQKPILGLLYALLATAAWGTLPIAAQPVLAVVDAQTFVWYRFVIAALGLGLFLALTHRLPKREKFTPHIGKLILLGIIGLAANFFLFSEALNYIAPTTNQVLWQLAPFTMILCGVLIFKEKFGIHQKIGLVLLIIGLGAFFNDRFAEILQFGKYAIGILTAAAAAMIWVCYGIAQKLLLKTFTSQQILLIIYFGCGIVLTPFATPVQAVELSGFLLGCFIYCCINTFIGYGAYAEALNHWDATKVSVITILLPIFTMIFSHLGHALFPTTFPELQMNWLSYLGAFVVVAGTILSAVGDRIFKR